MQRDRRRSRRVTPAHDTVVAIRAGTSGRLLDISPLGALVEIGFPLSPRKRCALTIEIPEHVLEVTAEVRRCRAIPARGSGRLTYQAALEFTDHQQLELEDWLVEQCLSETVSTVAATRTVIRVAEPDH